MILFLAFQQIDYDISGEFLVAGYGFNEIIKNKGNSSPPGPLGPIPFDPISEDPSLRELMTTKFKLVNVTNEFIIAYNPSSSACKGDSGQFEYFLSYYYYTITINRILIDLQVGL